MIYDLNSNPLTGQDLDVPPGEFVILAIQADCETGKFLRADGGVDVTVEGRFTGVGSYVNLQTVGIDTTPYAGTKKVFDLRVTAADISFDIENIEIEVKA